MTAGAVVKNASAMLSLDSECIDFMALLSKIEGEKRRVLRIAPFWNAMFVVRTISLRGWKIWTQFTGGLDIWWLGASTQRPA
jgi:hypothetical protein